ncbi:Hypothetical predicted protein, partial [Pelobates cultripes]
MVKTDTEKIIKNSPRHHQNLTPGEKIALMDLRQDPNIIIRSSDKGGATVIQSYDNYRIEVYRQLNDTLTYARLTFDPTKKFQMRIQNHIDLGKQMEYLDLKTAQFLFVEYPRHPVLYTLPKIHKDPIRPPGRPIVSANDSLLEPIAKYIDLFIK